MPKLNYYDDRRQRYPVAANCCGDALGGVAATGPSPPHHQVVDACVGMPPSQMHQSMGTTTTTTMQTSYDQCYSDYYHPLDGYPQQHFNQPNSSLALLSPSSSSHSTTSLPSNSPDNNNYQYGCYGRQPNGYNSSVSPSSSSSYYSANSPTDCYGVPAHPSATVNYHSAVNQHNNAGYVPPQQSMAYATPSQHHNNNNNNNNYTPSCSYPDYSAVADDKPGRHNSSRQMRNLAEKQRRTKLNAAINDLSQLVPMISNSSKKIEKTSVLRLSAVYLRLTQVLLGYRANNEAMPQFLNEINVCDLLLDDNDIFIMVASTGKIVFVSHSVENILGHQQVDLMGHSLFNITCIEDHVELANNLKVKDELLPTSDNQTPVNDTTVITKKKNEPRYIKQRRSFYMRLVKKQASRGKQQPELELVHVVGTLMIPNLRAKDSQVGGNDIILAAVVRPFNECRVTEVSLLEATREEYITRHQIDGRIIYVDQRISIVSGFMPHEVSGTMAFTYMHKDDVRWVMIALRQMYFMGQSFGSSCYRLLSKNGEFVYMKTHGYLELNPNEDSIESFVCINTLVSPEEGKREILKMREKYSVLIENQSEPGITAITDNELMEADSNTSLEDAVTEDPVKLHKVVKQMILNIPGPAIDNVKETAQNPLPHLQFMKVALLSKSLPKIKPETDAPKINKSSSLSPKSNTTPPTQNRPSVLRKAPSTSGQPVLIYNDQTIANSTEKDRLYYEQRGGVLVLPKRHNDLNIIAEHSSKKQKVFETEIDSPSCSQYSNQQMDDSQSDNQLSTDDYGSVDEFSSINTPIQFSAHNVDEHSIELDPLTEENITALDAFSKTLDNETSIDPLFLTPESYISYDPGPYAEGNSSDVIQDSIMHVLQQDGCKGSELLQSKQIALKTKMDQRQGQLTEIQTELNSLSSNADTHFLTANLSNLKAAHEEQQQMLQSLTEVHNNIGV